MTKKMQPPLLDGLVETGATQRMVLPVLAESVAISKRRVRTGSVKVSTVTQTHEEVAELLLNQEVIEVTRVPRDQVVSERPQIRTEGDTTIIPVFEERLVVTKQLVLTEELHIRRKITGETVRQPVSLRRQRAVVERSPRVPDIPTSTNGIDAPPTSAPKA